MSSPMIKNPENHFKIQKRPFKVTEAPNKRTRATITSKKEKEIYNKDEIALSPQEEKSDLQEEDQLREAKKNAEDPIPNIRNCLWSLNSEESESCSLENPSLIEEYYVENTSEKYKENVMMCSIDLNVGAENSKNLNERTFFDPKDLILQDFSNLKKKSFLNKNRKNEKFFTYLELLNSKRHGDWDSKLVFREIRVNFISEELIKFEFGDRSKRSRSENKGGKSGRSILRVIDNDIVDFGNFDFFKVN